MKLALALVLAASATIAAVAGCVRDVALTSGPPVADAPQSFPDAGPDAPTPDSAAFTADAPAFVPDASADAPAD
jgi:hypothetical protein|nr:hypothetical protein [Kofleriaceae bacterium]